MKWVLIIVAAILYFLLILYFDTHPTRQTNTRIVIIDTEKIKTVCFSAYNADRCADTLLLWELISTMEKTK